LDTETSSSSQKAIETLQIQAEFDLIRSILHDMMDRMDSVKASVDEMKETVQALLVSPGQDTPKIVAELLREFFRKEMVPVDPWAEEDDDLKVGFFAWLKGKQSSIPAIRGIIIEKLDKKSLRKKLQSERAQLGVLIRSEFMKNPLWVPLDAPKPPALIETASQKASTPATTKEDLQKWRNFFEEYVHVRY
jgi:hypothetical protein